MNDGKHVLIGTYRPECEAWIQSRRLYNLPIVKGIDGALFPRFTHLVLIAKGRESKSYAVHFSHVADAAWLKDRGYPTGVSPHSEKYAIFSLTAEGCPSAEDLLLDASSELIVSTARLPHLTVGEMAFTRALPTAGEDSSATILQRLKPFFYTPPVRTLQSSQSDFLDDLGMKKLTPAVPFPGPSPKDAKFTFIDLFAGIGGFRQAMQECGGRCVFTSEFDPPAQKTYEANYGDKPYGDITKQETKDAIPRKFDIVCAGFPCQAFSLAGKRMGFNDNFKGLCRGTLFKEVVEICEVHRPKAVFCENVKGLLIHDGGRTLQVIKGAFEEIGYKFQYDVLNSRDFGVPQNRERVYMVAFRDDIYKKLNKKFKTKEWSFPFKEIQRDHMGKHPVCLEDILEKDVPARYYLSDVYMDTLRKHKARHAAAGHGFGFEIRDRKGISGAIVCGGMGRERNLVQEVDKKTPPGLVPETHIKGNINQEGIRKMTPREWARLQGFPEEFKFVLSDVHLYKQFGNSVSVPVIKAISEAIVAAINSVK